MGNLNKVQLIGFLGQDPEKRVTSTGSTVVTLSLATTEKFTDKQGNKKETVEWHRVIFWNKQAELLDQYCKKGSQLYIEGSLQTREWQDKEGNKRWSTEIIGRNMQFLDSRGQPTQGGQGGQQTQGTPQTDRQQPNNHGGGGAVNPQQGERGFIDDDIPF